MGFSKLPNNFEIAPGYTVDAWRKLILDEKVPDTADWRKAVKILGARFKARFLEPADALIEAEKDKERGTFGFAILAIDFLVMESIQGFREGRVNHRRQSRALFKAFLLGWVDFAACVAPHQDVSALADDVYEQGRCALHHTGSTDRLLVGRRGLMFVFHGDGRIEINRSLLHQQLKAAFDAYLNALAAPDEVDLRRRFKAKMNHICGN